MARSKSVPQSIYGAWTTAPVEAAIREELGDERIRVAQIGLAGEIPCALRSHYK